VHLPVKTKQRLQQTDSDSFGPKRKQSVFVKEEELKCFREDRAGTPHISELLVDDDVAAPLSVAELSMGGEAEALTISRATHVDAFVDTYGH
jgi:hypothetical protein